MTTTAVKVREYEQGIRKSTWGEPYCGNEPSYIASDGEGTEVWMYRKGQRVRFFDANGAQVGPEHRNVAPAVVWAANEGWMDPRHLSLSVAAILETRGKLDDRPSA